MSALEIFQFPWWSCGRRTPLHSVKGWFDSCLDVALACHAKSAQPRAQTAAPPGATYRHTLLTAYSNGTRHFCSLLLSPLLAIGFHDLIKFLALSQRTREAAAAAVPSPLR